MKEYFYDFVSAPQVNNCVPADVTHLTLRPTEKNRAAYGKNLFAPISDDKWGPYTTLEVLTLAEGFTIVGDTGYTQKNFYMPTMPHRADMTWDAPALREVRLPSTVYYIRQGVLDDLGVAVTVSPNNPYYYNTPDGALYDRRTDTLVHLPNLECFTFAPQAKLTPAWNCITGPGLLFDQTPLAALRGAVRRGLRQITIPQDSSLAAHWEVENGVLYDRVLGQALLCIDHEMTHYAAPAWCTSIAPWAFTGCADLQSVTLTAEGVRVYQNAFADCPELKTFDAPESTHMLAGRYYSPLNLYDADHEMLEPSAVKDMCAALDKLYQNGEKPTNNEAIGLANLCDGDWEDVVVGQEYETDRFPKMYAAPLPQDSAIAAAFAPAAPRVAAADITHMPPQKPLSKEDSLLQSIVNLKADVKEKMEALLNERAQTPLPEDPTLLHDAYNFADCKHVEVPDTVTRLFSSFVNCPELEEVTLPAGMQSIVNSFNNCPKLKRVTLRSADKVSLTKIMASFQICAALEEIPFIGALGTLESSFRFCDSLRQVLLPRGLHAIVKSFVNCSSLRQVIFARSDPPPFKITSRISYTVTMVDSFNKTALLQVALPDRLYAMKHCFCDCPELQQVAVSPTLRSMERCFCRTALRFPPNLSRVIRVQGCFEGCEKLVVKSESMNFLSRCEKGKKPEFLQDPDLIGLRRVIPDFHAIDKMTLDGYRQEEIMEGKFDLSN